MKFLPPLLLALTLVACGDNFAEVQEADTIEAYEDYLKNNPGSRFEMAAIDRLESLYLLKAREEGLEGYDAYLERFPEGNQREKALKDREGYLFAWAENENTLASWERFLEEYPKADKARKRTAESMINVHKNLDGIEIGAAMVEQVNLAEDPEGPLDGWKITVPVTNTGKQTFEELRLTVVYLDENGHKVGSRQWPLVAPYWKVPIEEEHKKPFAPGDELDWYWTTGNVPEGWSRQVKAYVSLIKLKG